MSARSQAFDTWIRSRFTEVNTALEETYFAQEDRANVDGVGEDLKRQLLEEGQRHIVGLLREGNTDEGFDRGFDLLGNVGLYMAACERHGITSAIRDARSSLPEASALAMQLGASLGVSPRFATSHLATHNRAVDGRCKSFTRLEDERIFNDYNTLSILAYKRAADALLRTLPLGVTHRVTLDLLKAAGDALRDVTAYNETLFTHLNVERFFYNVRPYFKSHRVGPHVYRGANAGDFAGINVIDLLLGLCRADHAYYSQLLVDKFLYMLPEDQAVLRDCMRRQSLMDEFLALGQAGHRQSWYRDNLEAFLELCALHGQAAAQHHDQLVDRFITGPSAHLAEQHLAHLTASGPPLPVLLRALETLRDLRLGADRPDIPSRHADLQRLRQSIQPSPPVA